MKPRIHSENAFWEGSSLVRYMTLKIAFCNCEIERTVGTNVVTSLCWNINTILWTVLVHVLLPLSHYTQTLPSPGNHYSKFR